MKESFALPSSYPVESLWTPECLNRPTSDQMANFQLGQNIIQIMLNSSHSETVLPKLSKVMAEAFQVDYCLIGVIASDAPTVQTSAWYPHNCPEALSEFLHVQIEHLLRSMTITSTDPLAIADVSTVEIESSWDGNGEVCPVKSVLGITTRYQGEVNGVVMMMRSQVHDWTASEKEQLKAASDSIAMVISQIQLQTQLNARAEYQSLLNHLTRAIRSTTQLDQILQLAIDGTARTLQVDQGLILLLKYTDPLLKSLAQQRLPKAKVTVVSEWSAATSQPELEQNQKTLLHQSFWLSDCLFCQQAFSNAPSPMVITNQTDVCTTQIAPIFDLQQMPTLLLVPLESQGNVLGLLVLQQRQPRRWMSQELEVVELVSAQMSTAILQFQTMRQTTAVVEERTAQLQSSLAVQAKLYEKTRQQVDQLRQANQRRDEFIDTVSHELKTPLTKMSMAIALLHKPELSPERRAKYVNILKEECDREVSLINDLLALQKLESHQSSFQPQKLDLKQLILSSVQCFKEKWADKGLTLAVDLPKRSLMLQSDPDSLNRILQELLTNAGKYSDPETTIHLSATYQVKQSVPEIILTVSNIGSGISPTEQTFIFDKFRRGEGVTKQAIQGTGLGLALVKSLVEHVNGKIAVSSKPITKSQRWETCFTLTLPQFSDSMKV